MINQPYLQLFKKFSFDATSQICLQLFKFKVRNYFWDTQYKHKTMFENLFFHFVEIGLRLALTVVSIAVISPPWQDTFAPYMQKIICCKVCEVCTISFERPEASS